MVAGEHHDRVFPKPQFVKNLQDSADVLVDLVDVAEVLTHRLIEIAADLQAFIKLVVHRWREVLSVDPVYRDSLEGMPV